MRVAREAVRIARHLMSKFEKSRFQAPTFGKCATLPLPSAAHTLSLGPAWVEVQESARLFLGPTPRPRARQPLRPPFDTSLLYDPQHAPRTSDPPRSRTSFVVPSGVAPHAWDQIEPLAACGSPLELQRFSVRYLVAHLPTCFLTLRRCHGALRWSGSRHKWHIRCHS